MIRLFRKIRSQLLSEKRYSIYILYASGEILLVMVGILLALQIDNWNDSRKDRIEELKYLQSYSSDLSQDTAYLNYKIHEAQIVQDSFDLFMNLLPQQQVSHMDMVNLIRLPNWLADELILQDYTFQEITNSGKFGLFRDSRIKEGIVDYYKSYEISRKHISEMTASGLSIFMELMPHLARYFNYESLSEYEIFPEQDWDWINKPEDLRYKQMEAAGSHYRFKSDVSQYYYRGLHSKAESLLTLIAELTHESP